MNRYAAPSRAIGVQTLIVITIAVAIYFLGPLLYPGVNFSMKVFFVIEAATTVIWCLSMIILFLDLPILLRRFRDLLAKRRDQLIAPPWVLYLCSVMGAIASLVGIWATLSFSWDNTLIPDDRWGVIIGTVVFVSLAIGLLGSAYPRLLSSLDEQTAAARENARLYQELRTAYTKLSELDQLKDAFLTTASHELRTPLTIVQGYLDLLREMEGASPELRRSFLDKACRACEELVLLQANIMDTSRIEFDVAILDCSNIALKGICTTVVDLFKSWILKEQRSVEIDVAANVMVLADETRLKQIFHNLIANALRYSPQQTPIRISATVEEECLVRVRVIDRGAGIPSDKQEIIFDKFVRLERDMHGDTRGSGLGLYITQQLVEAMKGTITVESSGISNEGSTFSFTLPLAPSRALATKEL